jgi:hypothetical protein
MFLGLFMMGPQAAQVTIHNSMSMVDINGDTLDAHDGCLKRFGQTYYLYGTTYNNQNGFTYANRFSCYSSPDLVTWTPHGDITRVYDSLPLQGMYFRPHVIFNKRTGKYVLWYNWYPAGTNWNGKFGVAQSDNPWGPFVVYNSQVTVPGMTQVGDFAVFADGDTTGYCVYGWHNGSVGKLSDDFLSIQTGATLIGSGEGFCMFKRQNIFYFQWGNQCCFCSAGASANISRATVATGPFTTNAPASIIGATTHAQALGAAEISTTSGSSYSYLGDRWQSTPDGIKGHDFIYFSEPMVFDGSGNIAALASFSATWTVDLAAGIASAGPVMPKNLAKGKTVTSSSSNETGGWGRANLTDGRYFSESAHNGFSSSDTLTRSHIEWVTVDLGAASTIGSVKLFPRMATNGTNTCPATIPDDNDGNYGAGFPVSFSIQTSTDNTSWTIVTTVTNLANPGIIAKTWSFTPVSARYVRIYATALGLAGTEYRLQLSELAVYAVPAVSIKNQSPLGLRPSTIVHPQPRLLVHGGRGYAGDLFVGIYYRGTIYNINGRKCQGIVHEYSSK